VVAGKGAGSNSFCFDTVNNTFVRTNALISVVYSGLLILSGHWVKPVISGGNKFHPSYKVMKGTCIVIN
jgi:hypothetical protein